MTESSPECASSADVWPVLTALEFGRALPIELRQTEVRIDAATRLKPALGIAGSTIHPAQGGGDEN
jgi:hypothetical protein